MKKIMLTFLLILIVILIAVLILLPKNPTPDELSKQPKENETFQTPFSISLIHSERLGEYVIANQIVLTRVELGRFIKKQFGQNIKTVEVTDVKPRDNGLIEFTAVISKPDKKFLVIIDPRNIDSFGFFIPEYDYKTTVTDKDIYD